MIRYSLLTLFIGYICIYSFKDWYRALCILIPLLAVFERPDMPRSMLGIPGLNPYNLALAFVLVGAFLDRKNLKAPVIPTRIVFLAAVYFVVILVGFLRMFFDRAGMYAFYDFVHRPYPSNANLFIDHFFNHLKFFVPGILLARGTNSKERVEWATYSVLLMGVMLGAQIVVKMVPALIGQDDLAERALRVLDRDIGYHRVDAAYTMAMVAAGFVIFLTVARTPLERLIGWGGAGLTTIALALTGGRAGFMAWVAAVAVVALFRQRKLLMIAPIVLVIALPLIPGLEERITEGFSSEEEAETELSRHSDLIDDEGRDLYAITSGRLAVWPLVIEKIREAPWIGYGKNAMQREGITLHLTELLEKEEADFAHPHNAYLELVLDTGIIGATPVLILFMIFGLSSLKWFRLRQDREITLSAGMALVALTVFAISSLGAGSFYPKASAVIMWCMVGAFTGIRYAEKPTVEAISDAIPDNQNVPQGLWLRLRKS